MRSLRRGDLTVDRELALENLRCDAANRASRDQELGKLNVIREDKLNLEAGLRVGWRYCLFAPPHVLILVVTCVLFQGSMKGTLRHCISLKEWLQ